VTKAIYARELIAMTIRSGRSVCNWWGTLNTLNCRQRFLAFSLTLGVTSGWLLAT